MRTVVLSLIVVSTFAAEPAALTIVLDYEQQGFSESTQKSMEEETSSLLESAGLTVDWTDRAQAAKKPDMRDVFVFRMRGKCTMDSLPVIPDELGMPFALTRSTDGQVLSFGEVDCNRVRNATKAALVDFSKADHLYGRALGRVLAHEVYHMLAKSKAHAGRGVSRQCLSPRELTAEKLDFPGESLDAIRAQIGLLKTKRDSAKEVPSNATLP